MKNKVKIFLFIVACIVSIGVITGCEEKKEEVDKDWNEFIKKPTPKKKAEDGWNIVDEKR